MSPEASFGPERADLSELTPAEITDQHSTGDIAQSMADELTLGQLRDKLAEINDDIDKDKFAIAALQDRVAKNRARQYEINRAVQLASDTNPGV